MYSGPYSSPTREHKHIGEGAQAALLIKVGLALLQEAL